MARLSLSIEAATTQQVSSRLSEPNRGSSSKIKPSTVLAIAAVALGAAMLIAGIALGGHFPPHISQVMELAGLATAITGIAILSYKAHQKN